MILLLVTSGFANPIYSNNKVMSRLANPIYFSSNKASSTNDNFKKVGFAVHNIR